MKNSKTNFHSFSAFVIGFIAFNLSFHSRAFSGEDLEPKLYPQVVGFCENAKNKTVNDDMINLEKDLLSYRPNLPLLKLGHFQVSSEIKTLSELKKMPEIGPLLNDFVQGKFIIVNKIAFMMEEKHPDFYSLENFHSQRYIESLFHRTSIDADKTPENEESCNPRNGINYLIKNLYVNRFIQTDVHLKSVGALYDHQQKKWAGNVPQDLEERRYLEGLNKNLDMELASPTYTYLNLLVEPSKFLNGVKTFSSFYKIPVKDGHKMLVVTYQFVVVNPANQSFVWIKNLLGTGTCNKLISKNIYREAGKLIDQMRVYK